jgi:phosphatidylglycerol---prolipoprotein diacylglyceryl transferase
MIYVDRLSPFLWHTMIAGHEIGIRWYGLAYLLSFVLAYWFFRQAALRGAIPGLKVSDVDILTMYIVAGVMVGGRLGFVLQHPRRLLADPIFLIAIWEGGMAFFGGLLGVILAGLIFARQRGVNYLALTDVAALPALLGLCLGRIANFVNGELYGRPTGSHWGVVFPSADMQPRHPSQLYESASHLLLFVILLGLSNRWQGKVRSGGISYIFLLGYGILRFITDFWRQDDTYWGPFSDGQWFSLAVAVAGLISFLHWRRTARIPPR